MVCLTVQVNQWSSMIDRAVARCNEYLRAGKTELR